MRVACLQENLARGLNIVSRAVATRNALPVLANILLRTEGGQLVLAATDLELAIRYRVGAQVDEDGAITVPARLLSGLVNSLPPERIDMAVDVRTKSLSLRCAEYETSIRGIDAVEFPLLPAAGADDPVVALPGEAWREMIEQVTLAAATDESRPVLTGVLLRLEDRTLTLAASDGFRLSVRTAELPCAWERPQEVVVPARALAEVGRACAEEPGAPVELSISAQSRQAFFRLGRVSLVSQLLDGSFPDYSRLIPTGYVSRATLDTAQFRDAVRLALFFARDSANVVRLRLIPGHGESRGGVQVAASSAETGSHVGQLAAVVEGEEMSIAFNARYLLDALNVMRAEQVVLEATAPTRPGALRPAGDPGFLHVIHVMVI